MLAVPCASPYALLSTVPVDLGTGASGNERLRFDGCASCSWAIPLAGRKESSANPQADAYVLVCILHLPRPGFNLATRAGKVRLVRWQLGRKLCLRFLSADQPLNATPFLELPQVQPGSSPGKPQPASSPDCVPVRLQN